MGLDMWLYANSRRVCEDVNDPDDKWEREHQVPNGIAICWRKANQVHRWFVENVQGGKDDCGLYEVEPSDLEKLRDACRQVLESTELVDAEIQNGQVFKDGEFVPNIVDGKKLADPSVAMEVLPAQDGFFFGGTDYDQWYWEDVRYTEDKLSRLLNCIEPSDEFGWRFRHKDEQGWNARFYYSSSW